MVQVRGEVSFPLTPQVLDHELVLEFFWKFSVFECALKRQGFLREGWNRAAEANWSAFGRKITGQFESVTIPGFHDAVKALTDLSPHRQVVCESERLCWEAVRREPREPEESYTLRLLKTVRNNLFHGGKYPDGPVEEIARDREILRAALVVLNGCYALHDGIRRRIDEAAELND